MRLTGSKHNEVKQETSAVGLGLVNLSRKKQGGQQADSLEIKVAEGRAYFPLEPQEENRQTSTITA